MDDNRDRRTDAELEAMLRDLEASDLELLEPPDDVWEGIESAVKVAEDLGVAVPFESRRRIPRLVALGIAAVLVVVVAGLATLWLTRDDPGEVVAAASLVYDPETFDELGAQAQARAELVVDNDRHSIMIVDAALPSPGAGADLEVWLILPDAAGGVANLVSLGVIDSTDPGSLTVPAGYDPDAYFVVDISVEPRDGDATHSGRTILRGPLQQA
ncbi:MAG: anti-sigma factor [Acidobacteria bacterium]|nr:anti-sigma factor [Acidimicrobiaceae bacterium]MYN66506.1 anti-sigma factor [Acidobacteriota bacterium]